MRMNARIMMMMMMMMIEGIMFLTTASLHPVGVDASHHKVSLV
jgi:hypothetical protein